MFKGLKNFVKLIFSFKSYNETHVLLMFFGFKIKFPKYKYYILKKQSNYYFYKKLKRDITKIPPATGKIRQIQLANVVLLEELDYVCKQNNIEYWLDGGTLLGAVRHKGYVPWDDDIDVGMMAQDYEKIIDAFKKSSRNKDIYADYCRNKSNPDVMLIKVMHRKTPHLFVDIFPFYCYGKTIDEQEQLNKTKEIKNIRKELKNRFVSIENNQDLYHLYKETMNEHILAKDSNNNRENTDLVWGIDYDHRWKNWFTNYNVIFPLKLITFEGKEYLSMNNPDAFLRRVYGEYMEYPSKITFGHSLYKCDDNEFEVIKDLASGKNKG